MKQIHDDLDAAVFDAYGWPATLTDEEILERLVALNAERAAEEAQGIVRWLRPDFQNPSETDKQQKSLAIPSGHDEAETTPLGRSRGKAGKKKSAATAKPPAGKGAKSAKQPWPKGRDAQAKGVLAVLRESEGSITADELAKRFARAPRDTVEELLQALSTIGQARRLPGGRYTK